VGCGQVEDDVRELGGQGRAGRRRVDLTQAPAPPAVDGFGGEPGVALGRQGG
jgi:hypothetical protein